MKKRFLLELDIPEDMEWFFSPDILGGYIGEGFKKQITEKFGEDDAKKYSLNVSKLFNSNELQRERIMWEAQRDMPIVCAIPMEKPLSEEEIVREYLKKHPPVSLENILKEHKSFTYTEENFIESKFPKE
jgi:hypothetical protein